MFVRTAVLVGSLFLALSAQAQGRSDAFLDLVGRVPTDVLTGAASPGAVPLIHFADLGAAAAALDPLPSKANPENIARFGPYVRLQSPLLVEGLAFGVDGAWDQLVGFGPFDVEASLSVAAAPSMAMLLRLDPAAAERVGATLRSSGYTEETRDGVLAWARGAEDFGIDLKTRDPADPFGHLMGSSSRVAVEGSLIAQANNWPALEGLVSPGGPKGHPDLPAMATVLDRPEWGEVALVQAVLLPDQEALAQPGSGIPPWTLGLMVDLASGSETVTLVLFSYPDRASAETAAAHLSASWASLPIPSRDLSLAELTGTTAEVDVMSDGDAPFVTVLALRAAPSAPAGWPVNLAFRSLIEARDKRDLALFGLP